MLVRLHDDNKLNRSWI